MKGMRYSTTFGIAFVCAMLFTVCNDTTEPPEIYAPVSGYGRISISLAGGEAEPQAARTVLPPTVFDTYVYTFTKAGQATGVEKIPDNEGFFTLEVGNYSVEVQAYTGNEGFYTLVASGVSSEFSVGLSNNDPVEVVLMGVGTGGQGKFSYTITYPAGAEAEITLQKWPDMNSITLIPTDLAEGNGITETLQLEIGSYLLTILVSKTELYAGLIEAVHIYPSISTVYTKEFEDEDLLAFTPITSAEIIITAPVKAATPDTTANGTGNFSIGAVSWSPGNNLFLGNTVYTATVILTANNRYTFTGLGYATINGQNAVITNNIGKTVTLSYTFPATDERTATDIAIMSQPDKLTYTHSDTLDLTGLVVTLTYDDTTIEDVPAAGFVAKSITANPAHGNHLIHLTHNGLPIAITYGELTPLTTNALTVNPKVITFTVDPIAAQTYNGNAHTPPVTVKDGTTILTLTTDYTVTYTNNNNAGTAAVTITGVGNYAGSSSNTTFTINSKVITFEIDPIPAQTYTGSAYKPEVTVKDGTTTLTLSADYTAVYTNNTNAGTAVVTIAGAGNYAGSTGSVNFTINKATGATVNVPTLNTKTHNSITINVIATPSTGQGVEYGISINNTTPSTWQPSLIFNGLNVGATYFVFARAIGNSNYETGTASSSLTVTTLQTISPNRFEYYWIDQHGNLVTTSGGTTSILPGETLSITAQGTGYVVKQWHLNGKNTGQSGDAYNFSTTTAGKYIVGLFVEKDGKPYNTNITITVLTVNRTVTIDMYDSYGDGWNGAALRININGTNLSSNATINSGGNTNSYNFTVSSGDSVNIYWVSGSYNYECSFIAYYADTPPSPAFTTSNNNNWNGSNALVYRLYTTSGTTGSNYLTGVATGTLLGSFTVQ